jgi:diguanylate cyclase (GGDEF)-like protein/PAS domain S-box-containing protein
VSKLFERQLAKATSASGQVDLELLGNLVAAAYEQSGSDRRRTDRSISLMIEELDQLNRGLEDEVAKRTAELREREQELDAAIENMPHGLIMFDATGRMVVCNRRYIDMYRLSPEIVRPGCTLRQLLEHRASNGTFSGDPEQFTEGLRASIAEGETTRLVAELEDGRTISLVNRRMPSRGWVATHEDITERRDAEKKIAYMAGHDMLTDLPNRVLLRERLSQALADVHRGERLSVLYIDLDHFKTVNDTLGHPIGDQLLRVVAGRLRKCVRECDTVARVGGDEFAIIQAGIEAPPDATALACRICDAIRGPYEIDGHTVIIDSSIGISLAPNDSVDPDTLMKNADMALYRAKAEGRGIYRFFEPEMDARMHARRMLELALRSALLKQEFEVYYQPIVNLNDNTISSFEALIRWHHPERGMVSPVEFIPLSEEIGLIVPLGEWIIRRACVDAAKWPEHIKLAVNLSPVQLLNPNLVSVVVHALAASGLAPNRLELEITEAVLMQNTAVTIATLHRLRDLGVHISMDDFGTGYSSLSYLRSFPFDKIKIDRSFIKGLGDGEESAAIVRAVAGLAQSLHMMTTAEGVETEMQMEHVRALGCTEMQGFLFSPPICLQDVVRMFDGQIESKRGAA